jgi:hypothetical protein
MKASTPLARTEKPHRFTTDPRNGHRLMELRPSDPGYSRTKRLYQDTVTGGLVPRRQAEDLTIKQRASRERKRAGRIGYRAAEVMSEHHFVRFGPYYNLATALADPAVRPRDQVMLGAHGIGTGVSGGAGQNVWLALSGLAEYSALSTPRAQQSIIARRDTLFTQVNGYYLWLKRPQSVGKRA